jgi:predicted nucleotidyltransferase
VTKNEILTALNKPDHFLLALVTVDGETTEVRYLREPFRTSEDSLFGVTSVNYDWDDLFGRASSPEPPQRPPVEHWIDLMVERLATQFSPSEIRLFGSHARGEADGDSDVDLLVVLPEVADRGAMTVEMRRALSDLPVAKDIVVTTPEEIEQRGHLVGTALLPALTDGRIVYPRG